MVDRNSIFREYYTETPSKDKYIENQADAVDVIIPIVHTNELWEANLRSFYREIPINRLLIGDGGCIDDSVNIAKNFPRVIIFDHKGYKTLGFSIKKLIEEVETDWFIYPHSDAYLPKGWFDVMKKYMGTYDWYGCPMQQTIMVEDPLDYGERPWAGAQMGRKKAFEKGMDKIDDDYIYRQEDFVWRDIIQKGGFKEGFVDETLHYHQVMHKPTPWHRKVKEIKISVELSQEEEARTWNMQVKGIIKYLQPNSLWLINTLEMGIIRLIELKQLNWADFKNWVKTTNIVWLPYISKRRFIKKKVISFIKYVFRMFIK